MRFSRILWFAAVAAALAFSISTRPAAAQSEVNVPVESIPTSGGPTGAPAGSTANTANFAPAAGSVGEALSSTVKELLALRDGLLDGGVALARTTSNEAGKFASGLAVISLVIAGIRFTAHKNPIGAWVELIETLTVMGIFAALYLGFDSFGPSIFKWFDSVARGMSGGAYDTGALFARIAGMFLDSFFKAIKLASWYNKLDAILSGLGLLVAFVLSAIASVVYTYFVMVGQLQVAVGLAVGLIALSLGFSDWTRKYFFAWFDFMVTASMYVVTAAIIANLVAVSVGETVQAVATVGTSTSAAGWKAASLSLLVLLLSFEIPKIAGSLFGTGGGASGGAAMSLAKSAWRMGK